MCLVKGGGGGGGGGLHAPRFSATTYQRKKCSLDLAGFEPASLGCEQKGLNHLASMVQWCTSTY